MKRKFILILLIALFVAMEVASAVTSHESITPDELDTFCKYQGMLGNLAEADKEFKMLLEPPNYPNFQSMYMVVSQLSQQIRTSKKYLEMLKNPTCNVSKYTRGLLTYYEANKVKIQENIKNVAPNRDIVNVLESFKKEIGIKFLSSIVLDKYGSKKLSDYAGRGCTGSDCWSTMAYTVADLLDIVQILAEKVDQLERCTESIPQCDCTVHRVCTNP